MGDGYVRIPNSIARDPRMTPTARAFYVVLKSYAHGNRTSCWPSRKTLARDMGCSTDTVKRLIHAVVDAGLVSVEQRPGRSSVYWFGPAGRGTHAPTPVQSRTDHPVHPCTAEEDKVKKTTKRGGRFVTVPVGLETYGEPGIYEEW